MHLNKWIMKTNAWALAVAIIVLFVFYDLALAWWATIPPSRPKDIPSNSAFIMSPSGGFILPLPKHGDWLYCWLDQERQVDRCRMTDTHGGLEYEGRFLPSDGSGSVPEADLQIDAKGTGPRLRWTYFRNRIMPIIHLRNGTILIPAEAAEAAKEQLKFLQEYHQ
jgi:hypothetical protein